MHVRIVYAQVCGRTRKQGKMIAVVLKAGSRNLRNQVSCLHAVITLARMTLSRYIT